MSTPPQELPAGKLGRTRRKPMVTILPNSSSMLTYGTACLQNEETFDGRE
jgi:hypothetical protein